MESSSVPASDSSTPRTNAKAIQQSYFECFADRDYDEFTDFTHLKRVIAYAMFGPPVSSVEDGENNFDDLQLNIATTYSEDIDKQVSIVYERICELAKFSPDGKTIYMSTLYICLLPVPENSEKNLNNYYSQDIDDIVSTPIFKIRKCIKIGGNHGCSFYVDTFGRTYVDWNDLICNNKFPEKIMVLPESGRYHGVIDDKNDYSYVCLQVGYSPACSVKAKTGKALEVAATVTAAASLSLIGIASFVALAPAVIIGTGVTTGVVAGYGLVSSVVTLMDRGNHGQSINVTDSEARGCWFNIGASVTSLGATAFTSVLARFAKNGVLISRGIQVTHDGIILLNVVTSGAGICNSLASAIIRYQETGDTPNNLEIFQLTSSLLFFTHSLVNFKTAASIIREAQTSEINGFREELLSKKQKKVFDKTVAETRRINNIERGNAEIIKAMKQIDNKGDFFAKVSQNNKNFNQNNVKISLDRSGKLMLNGVEVIHPDQLASMTPQSRNEFLSRVQPSSVSAKNVPINLGVESGVINFKHYESIYSTILTLRSVISYDDKTESFEFNLSNLIAKYSTPVVKKLVKLLKWITIKLSQKAQEQFEVLSIRGNRILEEILDFIIFQLTGQSYNGNLQVSIDKYFSENDILIENQCERLLKEFDNYLKGLYQTYSPRECRCTTCHGITFSSDRL